MRGGDFGAVTEHGVAIFDPRCGTGVGFWPREFGASHAA